MFAVLPCSVGVCFWPRRSKHRETSSLPISLVLGGLSWCRPGTELVTDRCPGGWKQRYRSNDVGFLAVLKSQLSFVICLQTCVCVCVCVCVPVGVTRWEFPPASPGVWTHHGTPKCRQRESPGPQTKLHTLLWPVPSSLLILFSVDYTCWSSSHLHS